MRFIHHPKPTVGPARPAVGTRRLGHSLVGGVLVATSLMVVACGSSEAPIILNTEKVERAIERSSLAQREKRARVSCPSGVHQKKDLVFSCTAVVADNSTRFVVTQMDGSGHVRYEAR